MAVSRDRMRPGQRVSLTALAALGALAAAPSSTLASDRPETSTITVVGEGVSERLPDGFYIAAVVHGRGPDAVTALRNLAEVQARVNNGLTNLDGLTSGKLAAGQVNVSPRKAPDCMRDNDEDDCPTIGYQASMRMQFRGTPVAVSGNAVSLASELGAESASTNGVEIDERDEQRLAARRNAYEDARRQAEELAAASGRRIVRILSITDPYANTRGGGHGNPEDEIVVTGTRITPSVEIPLEHPPVQTQARLSVVFEIE